MHEPDFAQFAGMLTVGVAIPLVVLIGIAFGKAIREAIGESPEKPRRREPEPQPPRVIVVRQVAPGPLWQNSRIWEDLYLRGQQQQHFRNQALIGTLPEIEPPLLPASTDVMPEDDEDLVWRLNRGARRRL